MADAVDSSAARAPSEQLAVDEARRRAIACLRHDIRQPMQVLAMGLRTVRASIADAETEPLLRAMERANEEVADTLRDLLDLLLLDLDEPAGARAPVCLDAVFDAVGALHAMRAEAAKIRLRIAPTRIVLHTDRRLLTRLLGNLVTNAMAHSSCRRVLLGARLQMGVCTIAVVDDGRGMPAAQAGRLSSDSAYTGSLRTSPPVTSDFAAQGEDRQGLGLYIVRRFADVLGAELDVLARRERGTAVRVRLAGPAERRAPRPRLSGGTPRALAGRVVAIVDDQRAVLDSLRVAFESLGATVIAAEDDLHFISEVMQLGSMPDLIILDFMLGRGSAERCLRILWSRFGRDQVKAVVLTGHADHPGLAELDNVLVLEKPLSDAAFARLVQMTTTDP